MFSEMFDRANHALGLGGPSARSKAGAPPPASPAGTAAAPPVGVPVASIPAPPVASAPPIDLAPTASRPQVPLPPLPYTGTLEKKSEMLGFFQPRRVELAHNCLRYFKEGSLDPRESFRQGDVLDVYAGPGNMVMFRAKRAGGEVRLYEMRAKDEETTLMWVALIRHAFAMEQPAGDTTPQMEHRNSATNSGFGIVGNAATSVLGLVGSATHYSVSAVAKAAGKEAWLDETMEKAKSGIEDAKRSFSRGLEQQLEDALTRCDDRRTDMLLDKALDFGMTGDWQPTTVRRAARRAAGRVLRDATEAADPKRLKGALVAARRLQAVDVPEFGPAVEKYRMVRQFPDGWDVKSMIMDREAGKKRLLHKMDISTNLRIKAFIQLMLDRTMRRVETRDRAGGIPIALEVVQVSEVQNEELWEDYLIRREVIKQTIGKTMVETDKGRVLPDDFLFATPDTEIPLSEVAAIAASGLTITVPSSAKTQKKILAKNPYSESNLMLFIPPDHDYSVDQERPVTDFIADALPGPPLETMANEAWLFHGTKPLAAESIVTDNFRLNLAGTSAGSLFGRGIYLAENCTKADEYCRADPKTGLHTMILCRAVLGRPFYTDELKPDPRACEEACLKGSYHSVLGDRKKCRGTFREFCVFDEDQVYPNYLVNYRRVMPGTK